MKRDDTKLLSALQTALMALANDIGRNPDTAAERYTNLSIMLNNVQLATTTLRKNLTLINLGCTVEKPASLDISHLPGFEEIDSMVEKWETEGSSVDAELVFENLEKGRKNNTLKTDITSSPIKYQLHEENHKFIEQINGTGKVRVGRFINGEFKPQMPGVGE
ncbi:hypothetical protein A9R01_03200 ['Osedax' symbiont bacterium Rs2_46_30_T18]|nr:hypothetical protein A9R01_03200 ['Osedax' symbiont bacterium Rs2_46_30_T18]